jgi:hypothetical protein
MANLGGVGGSRCIIPAVYRSESDFVRGGTWNRRGREYRSFKTAGLQVYCDQNNVEMTHRAKKSWMVVP